MINIVHFERRIQRGDIGQALNSYGKMPVLVILNKRNEKYAAEVPEGIKVEYRGGALSSEVWLSDKVHPEVDYTGYFNITRDNDLIAADTHFWCQACVVARPNPQRSPDPRYCQGCYDVLKEEAEIMIKSGNRHRPDWMPKDIVENEGKKLLRVSKDVSPNLSTVNGKKIKVDKLPSRPSRGKPGPKSIDLPDDIIRRMAVRGMGSKAIASELIKQGYQVSYKTIQRRIQGMMEL